MSLPLSSKGISIAIVLSTLALSALFLARGTTSLVASKLFPLETTSKSDSAASKATQAKKAPGTDPPNALAILRRNAFDPSTGPLPKPEEVIDEPVVENAEPEQPVEGQLPPACDSTVKLIASVHSERDSAWSFASLGSGSDAPLLYREGSQVGDRQVVAVYPRAVYLRQGNGKLCSLTLFVDPNAVKAAAPVAAIAPAAVVPPEGAVPPLATGGTTEAKRLDQAISKQSDTQYTVQRSFVDKLLLNQNEIMRAARIVPHEENGQVVGVKLYGIRRNSLLGKLGIQNGDLLRTINGYDMASPDSALEAYAKLRSASALSVAVTRRGQPMGLEYNIQ